MLATAGILVVIIVAAGIIYSTRDATPSDVATSTPVVTNTNNSNGNNTTTQPQPTAPLVVTNSSVSPSDTTAIVNGTVTPKGAFTTYWYEYGTSANLGTKTANQSIGGGFVIIQAPGYITNLVKNTTYYFRLVAENQYGRVAGNQFTFRTTEGNPEPVGSAPTATTQSANGISRNTANIRGEVNPNKAETRYWFEYGKTTSLGNVSAFSGSGNGSAKVPVSMSLSDLEPMTTYYFRLNAQNQFGTINGAILNFKTSGPAAAVAPKVVSQNATGITTTEATLNGTVNPSGAETEYWFEYSSDTLLGSVLYTTTPEISVGGGTNTAQIKANLTNLSPKTTYYFRLVAQNSQGTSRGSEITFKTK